MGGIPRPAGVTAATASPGLAERDDLLRAVLRAVLVARVRVADEAVAAAETAAAAPVGNDEEGGGGGGGDGDGGRDPSASGAPAVTAFHALKLPQISVEAYVERLSAYMFCSKPCWIAAMIYLDRLVARCGAVAAVTSMTVHRLLLTALVVAAKFYDDLFYDSYYYSKVGGITVAEANTLELEFLCGLDWHLVVDGDEYVAMERRLLGEALASPSATEAHVLALNAGLSGLSLGQLPSAEGGGGAGGGGAYSEGCRPACEAGPVPVPMAAAQGPSIYHA